MDNELLAQIAEILNANTAPWYLVMDFADLVMENGYSTEDRAAFVHDATKELRADLIHQAKMLDKGMDKE